MRTLLTVVGTLCAILGAIWFFQGIGVLPGSFMSGQRQWAVNGAIAFGVGVVLLVLSRRSGRPR